MHLQEYRLFFLFFCISLQEDVDEEIVRSGFASRPNQIGVILPFVIEEPEYLGRKGNSYIGPNPAAIKLWNFLSHG